MIPLRHTVAVNKFIISSIFRRLPKSRLTFFVGIIYSAVIPRKRIRPFLTKDGPRTKEACVFLSILLNLTSIRRTREIHSDMGVIYKSANEANRLSTERESTSSSITQRLTQDANERDRETRPGDRKVSLATECKWQKFTSLDASAYVARLTDAGSAS